MIRDLVRKVRIFPGLGVGDKIKFPKRRDLVYNSVWDESGGDDL